MTAATELWAAVVASYDNDGLLTLTNIRNRAATTITTATGEDAAQGVIDLWASWTQVAYDSTKSAHVEVGKQGVIAMLWRRGGSAAAIAQVKWEDVFGSDGLISKVLTTGPRGRQGPSSNSGVTQKSETVNGRNVRGWSDLASLPTGHMPRQAIAED